MVSQEMNNVHDLTVEIRKTEREIETAETPTKSTFQCPILRATHPMWIVETFNLCGLGAFFGK